MITNEWFFKYAVYYPVVYLRRQHVPKYIKELNKSQFWDAERLHDYQLARLKTLVKYSKNNVEHYKDVFKDIKQENFQSVKDIRQLPFLKKIQIKENQDAFKSKQSFKNLTHKTTGGSTGQPVTIIKTADAMARELAATWRAYAWAGVDIGDKQGRFWGLPKNIKARYHSKLIDFVTHRRRCSAFAFTEDMLSSYTKLLSKFRPKYFYGYVSMLVEYAEYFHRMNKSPPFDLKSIITTSEVLSDGYRNLIQNVFNARVFNEYGSGELGSVAHECEYNSMHVMAENMIVEVLDGERTCLPGEIGELVITELNNNVMPLIRYRTGDFASFSNKICGCGRGLPIIDNIVGRAYDMVRNKDGKLFHGEFFMYIFEDAKRQNMGVSSFQVQQIGIDRFIIRIKPEKGYSVRTQDFIRKRIHEGFDANTVVEFEEVDNIERQASGKMRLIIGLEK